MKPLPTITVLATVALVGCETSGDATPGLGDVPAAAVNACITRADEFWSAAPGTSVVSSAEPALTAVAGNWKLQMSTGIQQSTCTVDPIGRVVNVGPGWSSY